MGGNNGDRTRRSVASGERDGMDRDRETGNEEEGSGDGGRDPLDFLRPLFPHSVNVDPWKLRPSQVDLNSKPLKKRA